MDLEQFRRAYMQQQGITNTPKNAAKRTINLGKSISSIPRAVKKDAKEVKHRKGERKAILNDIRTNGLDNFNADTFVDLVKNGPVIPSHTGEALHRTGDAAAGVAKSLNEFGQTAASIAGGKRSDMYDGQDLENGIRYAINARDLTSKHMRLPLKAFRGAINIGFMTKAATKALRQHDKSISKPIPKTHEKSTELPDIGGNER